MDWKKEIEKAIEEKNKERFTELLMKQKDEELQEWALKLAKEKGLFELGVNFEAQKALDSALSLIGKAGADVKSRNLDKLYDTVGELSKKIDELVGLLPSITDEELKRKMEVAIDRLERLRFLADTKIKQLSGIAVKKEEEKVEEIRPPLKVWTERKKPYACAYCGKPVKPEEAVIYGGKAYHKECFIEAERKRKKSVIEKFEKPVCPLCGKMIKPEEMRTFLVTGEIVHASCKQKYGLD